MPILNNVLGLDLGSFSVKGVELQQSLRGFQAVQLRSLPRDDAEFPLPELVRRFVNLYRFETAHVVAALPGDRLTSRRLSFPFRDRRRLDQAVPFEVADDIPFELEDVIIDWQLANDDRAKAEVVATIAPRAEVAELLAALRGAGCEPRTLEAEGLVLGNLATVFDLAGSRLLLDLGHQKTTFCLLLDGRAVAARTVSVAGRALDQAIAADRGLSLPEAEAAKCDGGLSALSPGPAHPRTAAVLDRLARETARTLGSLEALLGSEPISAITLCGGTAHFRDLDQYLGQRSGLPTERLAAPAGAAGRGLVAGGDPVLFAPAIALALRGTAQARTRMNFRQDEFAVRLDLGRFRRDFAWTGVLALGALLLALLGFGSAAVLESRRAAAVEDQIARLFVEAFPDQSAPASPLSALRDQVGRANDLAEFLGVYRGNLSALDVLNQISNHVPEDIEIALDELSIDRQTVRMSVFAKSFEAADRLGAELAKFAPFADARIGAIENDKKRGGKRFNVTISLARAQVPG